MPEGERESTDMHVWSSRARRPHKRESKGRERERERVNIGRTRWRPPYTGRQAVRESVHLRVLGRWGARLNDSRCSDSVCGGRANEDKRFLFAHSLYQLIYCMYLLDTRGSSCHAQSHSSSSDDLSSVAVGRRGGFECTTSRCFPPCFALVVVPCCIVAILLLSSASLCAAALMSRKSSSGVRAPSLISGEMSGCRSCSLCAAARMSGGRCEKVQEAAAEEEEEEEEAAIAVVVGAGANASQRGI